MITRIGIAAGEIWHYLDKHERVGTLDDISRSIERDKDIVLMSVGWLAREGHIHVEGGPNYKISLR